MTRLGVLFKNATVTSNFDQQKLVGLCFRPSGDCHSHSHLCLRCAAVTRTGRTDSPKTSRSDIGSR